MHIILIIAITLCVAVVDLILCSLKVCSLLASILIFLLCVLAALCCLWSGFKKEKIISNEILKEMSLPNQNVELFKENEVIKEIKINNDFYTNIKCENENNFNKLQIIKKKYYNEWLHIHNSKKEEVWVVIE